MRQITLPGWVLAFGCGVWPVWAQVTQPASQVEQLQQQLRALQESFEKTQQEQRRQIEALQREVDALRQAQSTATNRVTAAAVPPSAASGSAAATEAEAKAPWSPADPITLLGNQRKYLNLSLDALVAAGGSTASDIGELQLGGHDPKVNGFTVQGVESVFEGVVDPFFRAQATLLFQVDSEGDSHFELEEAYADTMALPGNLQVRAGQFYTEFGRLNPTHPHTWDFVDTPLVNGRFLGPDGLRNPGARISWLWPMPFYSELFMAVQNSSGVTAYSFLGGEGHGHGGEGDPFGRPQTDREVNSFGDLLFAPRYAVSFDVSRSQTILLGASAALGPNSSGADTYTQIYGVDLFWKWKPARHHGGFPFVSWQTEGMWRRYEAGADPGGPLPEETLNDYGFYSEVAWGFRKGWVAALRGDWVSGDPASHYPDPDRDTRWRVSPSLTWYPSEYSKIRLQYNYDDRKNIGVDHSVWLQLEFLLGAHAAHRF